jgi:hypothetical protein
MNPSDSNLRQLVGRYLEKKDVVKRAVDAVDTLEGASPDLDLMQVLLHDGQGKLRGSRVLDLQRGIDNLLTFYGRLELAALCGAIERFPDEIVARARSHLLNRYVRQYYEDRYPLLLPQALLLRVQGCQHLVVQDREFARSLFVAFLDTIALWEDDPEVLVFLSVAEHPL